MPDNKTKNVAKNNNDKIQRSGIDKLIRKIRTSDNHDDVSIELYATMMFNAKAKPPYHKWVATWILKCIKETFPSEPYKQDIMCVSFALLPEYPLKDTTIQQRLEQYLQETSCASKEPCSLECDCDEINANSDKQEELKKSINNIVRMNTSCIQELINHIENIDLSEVEAHLHNLSDYGEPITLSDGKKGFVPKLEGLYYPKRKCIADSSESEQKKPQNITGSEPLGDLLNEQQAISPNIIENYTEITKDDSVVEVRTETEYDSEVKTESGSEKDTSILSDRKIGKRQSSDDSTDDGRKHKNRKLWFIVSVIGISIGFAILFLFLNINKEAYDQPADGSIYQPTPSMKVNRPDGTSLEFYGPVRYEETSDGCVIESISGEKKSLTGQLNKTVIDDDYMLEGVDESDKNY